ncbi:MAG: polymerase subunit gamma/tau [Frankiaceae bacterium]|nr:polymerase subunit gamma/tau [Frankiaceae bacterium]
MSLALYRKYRPATFAEVIGQEHVTTPLAQALLNDKVHHAYLFSGPRGCGKTSSARILARSLNCEKGPTPEPCGVCDSCVALAPGGPGGLDVIEIDAASHGGVDDARDLRERAFFSPVSSRFKIYIIDEAHLVTREGFNALLKLVEEPPPHLKFVFATTEPEKVIGTIRSRTHHYPFRLVAPDRLRDHLSTVCAREGVTVEPLVLPLVVRASGGSVRDALSVLDQLLSGVDAGGLTYARAVALLGFTDSALLDDTIDALSADDGAALFETVDRVVEGGHDPRRFAGDLLERVRDLIVLNAVPDAAAKGLIDCPVDQVERMSAQAARLGPAQLSRLADILALGLTEMRGATAPRLLLELICARLLLPAAAVGESGVLARLDRLERRLSIAGEAAPAARIPVAPSPPRDPAPRQSAPPEPAPRQSAPPEAAPRESTPRPPLAAAAPDEPIVVLPPDHPQAQASAAAAVAAASAAAAVTAAANDADGPTTTSTAAGDIDAAGLRRVWPDVLEVVKGRKRTTWALLAQYAQVVAVTGRALTLEFSTDPIRRQFAGGVNEEILKESLRQVLGVDWQITSVGNGNELPPRVPADQVDAPEPPPSYDEGVDVARDEEVRDDSGSDAVTLLSRSLGATVITEIDTA